MTTRVTEYIVDVTTVGSAGNATGFNDTPPIIGEVLSIQGEYLNSPPATTKVDVDELDGGARKVLNKAAGNTNFLHYPRALMQDNTGANLTGIYERFILAGRKLRITVTLSNALAPAFRARITVLEHGQK